MTPDQFWDLTPWEMNWLEDGYESECQAEHQRRSWFFGHLISLTGQFRKPVKIRSMIDALMAPYKNNGEVITIRSREDLKRLHETLDLQKQQAEREAESDVK